ncbi:conserved hypothetical protein [Leishmania major strain Friedlin]|uniref:Uncharacterized protein n=1 Tax=Leishmania major TaxID=5664 RepID=Q4Q6N7_LEIMA|nr:conserved hypothetical protein [Leishmania major strain Friedlin]CAG9579177.1 hypothetical_protein_-_conserved [Leishmania major strain Friedlin]CAJ08213.1 conserved hypothetical protein [Leishmania major strain Friedlin]|eukprot:XP_001685011.1 conserved hypothetical protein [Leishmania major strain Friedlin]
MRSSLFLRCSNLHTIGLDGGRSCTTAAASKATFAEQAHSSLPETGGDAAKFRQLKGACDALPSRSNTTASGTGVAVQCNNTDTGVSNIAASSSKRAHIHEERYNSGGRCRSAYTGTWDYGSGERYANESTRNFYRCYSANYYDPRSTGFTREEVAHAERAMRLHRLKCILWNCLVYGSALYLLLEFWRGRGATGIQDSDELSRGQLEKARRHDQLRPMRLQIPPNFGEVQTARYLTEWNERSRDRELAVVEGCAAPSRDSVPSIRQLRPLSVSATRPAAGLDRGDEDDDDDDKS